MLPQGEGHVLCDGHAVEQGRLLKEKAETDAFVGQLLLAHVGQVSPLEEDLAAGGPQQSDKCFQEDSFAATAFADHRHGFAAFDGQVDPRNTGCR